MNEFTGDTPYMTSYQHIQVPAEGQKITANADMSLNVPAQSSPLSRGTVPVSISPR